LKYILDLQKKRIITNHKTWSKSFNGTDFYPENWHVAYNHIYPTSGFKILPNSAKLRVSHRHGDHNQEIKLATPYEIILWVRIHSAHGKDIGIFDTIIDYDEYQEETNFETRNENLNMNWGESKVIIPHKDEEILMVKFDSYDGKHFEYASPDASNYLKIFSEGKGIWKIVCNPPNTRTILMDLNMSHINISNVNE